MSALLDHPAAPRIRDVYDVLGLYRPRAQDPEVWPASAALAGSRRLHCFGGAYVAALDSDGAAGVGGCCDGTGIVLVRYQDWFEAECSTCVPPDPALGPQVRPRRVGGRLDRLRLPL